MKIVIVYNRESQKVINLFGVPNREKYGEKAIARLVDALKRRLGGEVKISTSVDPALIGGVLVRAGDTVIDGSVRGRLNRLAEQLNS